MSKRPQLEPDYPTAFEVPTPPPRIQVRFKGLNAWLEGDELVISLEYVNDGAIFEGLMEQGLKKSQALEVLELAQNYAIANVILSAKI